MYNYQILTELLQKTTSGGKLTLMDIVLVLTCIETEKNQ